MEKDCLVCVSKWVSLIVVSNFFLDAPSPPRSGK